MTSEPEAEQNLTEENGAALETRETIGRKERHGRTRWRSWVHNNNKTHGQTNKQTNTGIKTQWHQHDNNISAQNGLESILWWKQSCAEWKTLLQPL